MSVPLANTGPLNVAGLYEAGAGLILEPSQEPDAERERYHPHDSVRKPYHGYANSATLKLQEIRHDV